MANDTNSVSRGRRRDDKVPLLVIRGGIASLIERLEEYSYSFVECHAVILDVTSSFILIPLKLKALRFVHDIHASIVHGLPLKSTGSIAPTPPSPFSPELTETNRLSLDSAAIPK